MRLTFSASAALLLAPLAPVLALRHTSGMQVGPIEISLLQDTELLGINGTNGWGTFDQQLDHSDPSKGTFEQRFWYGTQYWKGPGSPIILTTPGEQAADGFNITYTTKKRLSGLMAEKMGAAVVILEHRYWGKSSPFQDLTVQNLQYHTLDNALKDLTYFANNFDQPFDKSGESHPTKAPWIFTGGSYPGALAGWLERLEPGTFWAYHGTSGVVEAMSDFYTYYDPAMVRAPKNCTKDLTAVIDHIDEILFHGKPEEKQALKDRFKLGDLGDKDFGNALLAGPGTWQGSQFYTLEQEGVVPLFQFCDYIENVFPNATNATYISNENGVGIEKALDGYAKWFVEISLPGTCESYGLDGFNGTYNTECYKYEEENNLMYKDTRVDNVSGRTWMWMLCNEPFEWWQTGAPFGTPSFVSRKVDVEYFRQQCTYMFPPSEGGYGILKGKTIEMLNNRTDGWFHTDTKRLMYANGQYDPWLDVTVSSNISRPGGPVQSTKELPIWVIPGGNHCSDLYGQNWEANAEVKAIADAEVEQMSSWVDDFYKQKSKREVRFIS
ncbi:serine-type peptidase [Apiospora aurea]|uniref:Serine-type peptidase n=1 Tax=Apiospora aurea TaxID=335848 RepID=A0ABR1PU78_9PEZI